MNGPEVTVFDVRDAALREASAMHAVPEAPAPGGGPNPGGGYVGRWNAYACESCGGLTVTIDRDAGVTPMFIDCRAEPLSPIVGLADVPRQPASALPRRRCRGGRAVSRMYPQGDPPSPPRWEFYKPPRQQQRRLARKHRELADYCARGGRLLREIPRSQPPTGRPSEKGRPVATCRACGCTDERGCPEGCWWIQADLCSSCTGVAGVERAAEGASGAQR